MSMSIFDRSTSLTWRRALMLAGVLLSICVIYTAFAVDLSSYGLARINNIITTASPKHTSYQFGNATLDLERIDGLTDEECGHYFPDLYTEIEKTVKYWREELQHTIQPQDLDFTAKNAAMRVLIHDNELRILNGSHAVQPLSSSPDRAFGVLHLINRALEAANTAGETLPTVEFTLNFQDDAAPPSNPRDFHAFWSFARAIAEPSYQRLFLMPNFDFWFYGPAGQFEEAKYRAKQFDAPFTDKIPKLVWRGNPGFNDDIRGALLNASEGQEWSDVIRTGFDGDHEVWLSMDEFCRYAMTVYTEGVTYSGRLKFLMNCQSLLFSHETLYATHYSHLLVADGPDQNYVSVERDWSDLDYKVRYYLQRPDEAERIIANSLATFRSRYTTRAAVSCYLRRLIKAYSTVAFVPQPHRPSRAGKATRLRGVPLEYIMDKPQDRDFEFQD